MDESSGWGLRQDVSDIRPPLGNHSAGRPDLGGGRSVEMVLTLNPSDPA